MYSSKKFISLEDGGEALYTGNCLISEWKQLQNVNFNKCYQAEEKENWSLGEWSVIH